MIDSLLQVCYNIKRKNLVDFSGFGHLFATQLSCDSCVAFFVVRISEVLAAWRTISIWKMIFFSYQDAPQRTAYQAEPVSAEALNAVLEAGTYAPTGGGRQSPTIIAITDPKYRQKIAKLNAEMMGSSTDPYYGAPVVALILADGSASTFVEDGSCRKPCAASGRLHWVIQPRKPANPQHANKTILFGFNVLLSGAIFLCRILCREEGKYADQQ